MRTMNWKVIITAAFCVFLTTACSKKLMPPEIETSGSASEGTEFTASSSSSSESDFGGSGGPSNSGFFSEEPILESGTGGSSGSFGSSSSSSGASGSDGFGVTGPSGTSGSSNGAFGSSNQANIGNGSTGSFNANPFVEESGSSGSRDSGSSGSRDSGIQESLLKSFKASANLKDIHFKFDQYDLDGNSREILKENADFIKSNPGLHVEIQGHCDERGVNNYNIALGERRAQSTKQYLVSQGVDSSNVKAIAYGEEKPFCFESNGTCWQQNRRAHFIVTK